MVNGLQKFLIDEKKRMLTLENTASFLGISTATVRNWIKCGYLKTLNGQFTNLFYLSEIENVKLKIANGSLEKLSKRANKSKADRTFIPEEYLQDKNGLKNFNEIVDFVQDNNSDLSFALLLLCLNLLVKEKILSPVTIEDLELERNLGFSNKQIKEEIKSWLLATKKVKIEEGLSYLLNCPLPKHRDILGFIYQSLLIEGEKSQNGSYYTPSEIVDEIVRKHVKKDSKVLDPCCGTGQFLLAFASAIEDPARIYGIDIDEIAVRIARINLLVHYKNKDFFPNIVCKNTLLDIGNYDLFSLNDELIGDFDVIATNPPWGLHFSKQEIEKFKKIYSSISSFESFAYFLKKSYDLLKKGGVLSFILPESLLNVKTHKDIRNYILSNSQIKEIVYLGRVFKNVFTPVIRLDIEKIRGGEGDITIRKENENYTINQSRWKNNRDSIFDIHANGFDTEIINKIYGTPHVTLENQADWALGIVTGSNSAHIINAPKEGYEEVYKGKDVEKFVLRNQSSYIQFTPEKFQQVAPIEKYRAKEKLIYRFISKKLIFAYDDQQKLTLNSANIVIPRILNYPIKVIAALFNSSLYQFIFQKKFSSIKVLRSHIEHLPLPLWDRKTFNEIVGMVDKIIRNQPAFEALDNYIMDKYPLSIKDKNYIRRLINNLCKS